MPTRNVNLTKYFDKFVEDGVVSGRFGNASEVVREGLRLLEQREEEDRVKIEWLGGGAQEGFDAIERGDYVTLDSEEDIKVLMDDIQGEVMEELGVELKRG